MGENEKMAEVRRYMHLIQQQTGKVVRPYREDGFVNVLNKYGTSRDTTEHYHYQGEPDVPDTELTYFYEGNGLFSKVIDAPAEEAIKHGFEIKDLSNDTVEAFYKDALDELDWDEIFIQCIKWTRLFGGCIAVMLINDGGDLTDPVDWMHVESIDDIRVYDRSLVQIDYSSLYTTDAYRSPFVNRGSKLGMPEFYYVYSMYGSFKVHESRCLVFQNGQLPERTTSSIYREWGVPEYIRIHRAIRDAEVAHGSAVKLLDRSIQAVYSMKGLSSMLATEQGESMVLKRLQTIDLARGLLNTITVDGDGEDYSFRQFSFSGVADVIDTTCNYLSALTNIPQTILFGRSPAGMNATGQGDLENWYNYVERIQKRMVKSNLRYLLQLIFAAGIVTGKIKEAPKIEIEFSPLWSLSEVEQVQLEQQKVAVQQARAAVAEAYVGMQAIDPSEVRKKLAETEEFDVETMLDDYTEEELEENAPQQQGGMPGMGGMPPEMMQMLGGQGDGEEPQGEEAPQDAHQSPEMAQNGAPNVEKDKMATDEAEPNCVGVLIVKDGYVLTGIRTDNGLICGPGGHIEDGETPEEAAVREAIEEFGVEPKNLQPIGIVSGNGDIVSKQYVALDFEGVPKCRDGEMEDPRWSSLEELLKKSDALLPAFKKALSLLMHELYEKQIFKQDEEKSPLELAQELFEEVKRKYTEARRKTVR